MAAIEENVTTLEQYKQARYTWLLAESGANALEKTPEELLKDKNYQKAKKVFDQVSDAFLRQVIAPNFWDLKLYAKERMWIADDKGNVIFSIDGPQTLSMTPFTGMLIRVHRANQKHDGFERYNFDGKNLVHKGISFGVRTGQ